MLILEMDLDLKYKFFDLKCICRFGKCLLGMTLISHRTLGFLSSSKTFALTHPNINKSKFEKHTRYVVVIKRF